MSQPPNFDEWHHGTTDDAAREHEHHHEHGYEPDDGEVAPQEHDLWGMTTQEGPARRRRTGRPDWFAPVMVMVAALLALTLAYGLTRHAGGGSSTTSAPSVSTPSTSGPSGSTAPPPSSSTSAAGPESSSASVPQTSTNPSSSAASATSSSASPGSSSGSPSSTAAFPDGSVATCGDGEPVPSADVRLAAGTHSSCAYVGQVVAAVLAHTSADPGATSFTVSPYSTSLHRVVALTCTRSDHLSTCAGGNDVHLWVRDSSN